MIYFVFILGAFVSYALGFNSGSSSIVRGLKMVMSNEEIIDLNERAKKLLEKR